MAQPERGLTAQWRAKLALVGWIRQLGVLPASAAVNHGRHQDWRFSGALTLLALLPRLYVAIAWAREPVWDGHYYHFGATRIAEGLGYSEDVIINGASIWKPWCHYPVGYSGFLGGLYKLFGSGLLVAPVANALIGALTALVIHRMARFMLPQGRARAAGLLCALHPGMILYTALVMTEGLAAFSMALAGLVALVYAGRHRGVVLAGAILGLSALVRPTALLVVPLLVFIVPGGPRKALTGAVIAGAMALLVISPWTLRNCRVMDDCALISTNGGWNLAIGALTESGRFTTLKAGQGCPGPGQVKQDRCWGKIGRDTILSDPGHWLRLIPKKLRHTYNHESFAVGYLGEANPELWTETRKNKTREGVTLFHHLLLFCVALSLFQLPRLKALRRISSLPTPQRWQIGLAALIALFLFWALSEPEPPLYWLIAVVPLIAAARLPGRPAWGPAGSFAMGLVLMTTITHSIFFGDDRYHMTIAPILCLLAAAALRTTADDESPLPSGNQPI